MSIFLLIVIIYLGYGLFSIFEKSIEAKKARVQAEREAQAIVSKGTDLSKKLETLKTPEGKESALREQFPVVKAGEHVVVIVDDSKEKMVTSQPVSSSGFWSFIKGLFR